MVALTDFQHIFLRRRDPAARVQEYVESRRTPEERARARAELRRVVEAYESTQRAATSDR